MTKTIIGKFGLIVLLIGLGLTIVLELDTSRFHLIHKIAIVGVWIVGGMLYIPLDEIYYKKELQQKSQGGN